LWQSSRIQNQHTKSSTFCIYQYKQVEEEIRKIVSFKIALKIKYLGINLTKEVKDLYNENYKILKKETEEDTRRWKDFPC
jgi:putative IMPACT (imprinted ancient) family translation regulator